MLPATSVLDYKPGLIQLNRTWPANDSQAPLKEAHPPIPQFGNPYIMRPTHYFPLAHWFSLWASPDMFKYTGCVSYSTRLLCTALELAGRGDLGVFVLVRYTGGRRTRVSKSRLWLPVCPCNVFNGHSTHRASLVSRMLITVHNSYTFVTRAKHSRHRLCIQI